MPAFKKPTAPHDNIQAGIEELTHEVEAMEQPLKHSIQALAIQVKSSNLPSKGRKDLQAILEMAKSSQPKALKGIRANLKQMGLSLGDAMTAEMDHFIGMAAAIIELRLCVIHAAKSLNELTRALRSIPHELIRNPKIIGQHLVESVMHLKKGVQALTGSLRDFLVAQQQLAMATHHALQACVYLLDSICAIPESSYQTLMIPVHYTQATLESACNKAHTAADSVYNKFVHFENACKDLVAAIAAFNPIKYFGRQKHDYIAVEDNHTPVKRVVTQYSPSFKGRS